MPFSENIIKALAQYDENKGPYRKLSGIDHSAITALKALPERDKNNVLKIHRCFREHPTTPGSQSDLVYRTLSLNKEFLYLNTLQAAGKLKKPMTEHLEAYPKAFIVQNVVTAHKAQILNVNYIEILLGTDPADMTPHQTQSIACLSSIFCMLNAADLLAQNVNRINDCASSALYYNNKLLQVLNIILTVFDEEKLLTQAKIDLFLSTCLTKYWECIVNPEILSNETNRKTLVELAMNNKLDFLGISDFINELLANKPGENVSTQKSALFGNYTSQPKNQDTKNPRLFMSLMK